MTQKEKLMKRKEKLGAFILLLAGLITVGCSKRTPRHSSQLNNSSETSSISSSGKKVTKKEVKKDYKKLYQPVFEDYHRGTSDCGPKCEWQIFLNRPILFESRETSPFS